MKKCFVIIVLMIFSISLYAQTWQDTVAKIENIFSRYKAENPGCQLSISRNGQILFSKAWGMADLERNVPLTTSSIIEAGSVSKQFTAAAILLLEQQEKLFLNDDVRKYIPELPDYGSVIQIKHLIHHTSGLRDWGSVAEIAGWPRTTKIYSNEDALYIICQQKKLNNKPGDEVKYSNSNYNLLAIIVQRISGMSLADFTAKNIFEPAGMKNTQWRDNYKTVVPNRALAYTKTEKGYETNMPNENVYGNGGLLTTTEDLLKWNEFYLNGKFGTPSLLANQLALDTLNNGEVSHYAAGLFVQNRYGFSCIFHGGETAGYRCFLESFPQLGLSIAFLSNTSQFGSSAIVREIETLLIKNDEDPKQKQKTKQLIVSKLNDFTGWYRDDKTGQGILFLIEDNELILLGMGPLTQTANNEFISARTFYMYSFIDNRLFQIRNPNNYGIIDTTVFFHVEPANLSEQNVNEYLGEYYSSEAQTSFIVIQSDSNKLELFQNPKNFLALTPTYIDGFNISGLDEGCLHFDRDKNNKVVKMIISIDRVRKLEFIKVKK